MNDPSKRIDVNISSLLSLKAELLRKQDEVNKAKEKQKEEIFVPKKGSTSRLDTNETNEEEIHVPEEYEDSELLNKSKKVLEAKAKYYDKMATSGGKLNSDDNCLVLFNQKRQDDKPERRYSSSSSDTLHERDNDADYLADNPDDEWVEYTDCLGRTRKCLKKDLEFFKKKDNKLAENIQPRIELNQNEPMWMIDTKGDTNEEKTEIRDDLSEMTSVMSKHDQMKMNWEKKEVENVYKEDVHYQDVLFDEARTHGVGYYAFSTDEEQRAKQRQALDEMRERTLEQQKQRESQRAYREKIIAERVKAAKNRQRARLGLPPLEDEPELDSTPPFDTKEEEKRKKREEKQKRKREKLEKRREEERKRHVRPWDRSKDGVAPSRDSESDSEEEWHYKPEREPMSQEQWNERKRTERNLEFGPMPEEPARRSFRAHPDQVQFSNQDPKESLFFTTKKPLKKREFVRKNYSTPNDGSLKNLAEYDMEETEGDAGKRRRGAEIAPPPTFEYYGPTSSAKHFKPPKSHLEQSIEAGLKFLRDQSDKGILPPKSNWAANADY